MKTNLLFGQNERRVKTAVIAVLLSVLLLINKKELA